jgi:hypothetical protein
MAQECATRPLRPPGRIDFFGSFCIKAKRTKSYGACTMKHNSSTNYHQSSNRKNLRMIFSIFAIRTEMIIYGHL